MFTFLAGQVTTYNLTLNLTGMINIRSLQIVVRPMIINTIDFFYQEKGYRSPIWLKRLRLLVVHRYLLSSVEM